MVENKTKPNQSSVREYLESLELEKRTDATFLVQMFEKMTNEKPVMWGNSIIGFGNKIYHYVSGRKVEYFLIGFSIRKKAITIYLMNTGYEEDFIKLGTYEKGVGCLYIKSLIDVNLDILTNICKKSIKEAIERN